MPSKHACRCPDSSQGSMGAHLEQQLDAVQRGGGCARHCACRAASNKHSAAGGTAWGGLMGSMVGYSHATPRRLLPFSTWQAAAAVQGSLSAAPP